MRALLLLAALAAAAPGSRAAETAPRSLLIVGWDGASRARLRELLAAGRLPNLARLVSSGSLADTDVTTGATETKPGWAEILTGLDAPSLGIVDNRNYRPIPAGATILERWKAARGPGACAVFVAAKINNLGARGPHEICLNCAGRDARTRAKTWWWDAERNVGAPPPGEEPLWVAREGEPYLHVRAAVDVFETGLGPADRVGPAALAALSACGARPFLAFVHFEDPDEAGHVRGEASPEYRQAFVLDDAWLGRLLDALARSGRRAETAVLVTTDHGMDPGGFEHRRAPQTWLAGDRPGLRGGDRKDAAATALDLLGLPAGRIAGRPLSAPRRDP